ncbi:MAG TPA: helix-turn-helix domain-containing protein [Proteobacteria bacterium]|nr:PTS sugar transporter subunit IIA [Deltaproteobacteria bacterium]HDS17220.1 helix-turn-helix domain-containing protein [Pseudomonadota bacterium]
MNLSVQDIAQLLNVSEDTIHRWIKKSIIPSRKINEQYRFVRSEILEWANARHMKLAPDSFLEKGRNGSTVLPSLVEAISHGGVIYQLPGNDSASVLRSMVALLNLPETVDREFLYQVLLARESLGSTGFGGGVAIPHVRNPVVLNVAKPSVTLCFLEKPIDFQALDGKPVNVLFTLISTTTRVHLHLLSRISYVLHNQRLQDALHEKASQQELLALLTLIEGEIPARN